MTRPTLKVTYSSIDPTRLPDRLIEAAALLIDLARRGVLTEVGQRLHIRRQGGYCGLDIWLFLFVFYTVGATRGIRTFWRKTLHFHHKNLAALAGRRSLSSPSSLSRALGRVENDLVRPIGPWLLAGVPQIDDLLRHPAAQTLDANGQRWHVFDYDPTKRAIRQRALPQADDLPEPMRDAEDTGAPGHTGRKRGDLVFRCNAAQHAGSGAWIHAHLSPGNGVGIADLGLGLDSIGQTVDRLDHPRERAMTRMDGEFGYIPDFTACRERRLPFITRLNRQKLFEDPAFLSRLRGATWFAVPDSLSGPRRAAAELGEWTVEPGKKTRRPDGTRYAPVTVRVVASIFPKEGKAGRGRVLDGWQIELFAADLDPAAWPAPEAVSAYFGRSGTQENRFAQEDRELGLDRIVSYHLPGQELAWLVGLSLWNVRLMQGFRAEPPSVKAPVQQLRVAVPDERVPAQWPRDPQVVSSLGDVDWAGLLAKKPGWSFDAATGEVRCEADRALVLTTVRKGESAVGRVGVIFRRPAGGCADCAVRPGCLTSPRVEAVKHAEFLVPSSLAVPLRSRLARVRAEPAWSPASVSVGKRAVADALFLPAVARQVFAERFVRGTLWVEVVRLPPPPPRPRLVAADIAERQRRRKTWEKNLARYALPEGVQIHIEVAGTPCLRWMIGEPAQQKLDLVGSG
jgi:hypothetical protein